jgi:hypothetical protein
MEDHLLLLDAVSTYAQPVLPLNGLEMDTWYLMILATT